MPWLPGGEAYEDWYLLEGSFALDIINRAAVTGVMTGPHHGAASLTGSMAAGLYQLVAGEGAKGETATWLNERPASIEAGASLWRRQMVLGPTPQFCLLGNGGDIARRKVVAV
ncbi:MAG TPA: hypothetical protein VF137_00325 [Candidatus Dormibacteraeota bacterium]